MAWTGGSGVVVVEQLSADWITTPLHIAECRRGDEQPPEMYEEGLDGFLGASGSESVRRRRGVGLAGGTGAGALALLLLLGLCVGTGAVGLRRAPTHSPSLAHPAMDQPERTLAAGSESLQPYWEFKNHTVIKPRFYHHREKREITSTRSDGRGEHIQDLIVGYTLKGKEHLLDLTLKRELLPDTYFQKHQENGQHKIHIPERKDVELCHYQGSLRNVSKSWAAVSTCKGLRGVLFDGEEFLYFEPKYLKQLPNDVESRTTRETLLFRSSDAVEKNLTCGYEGTPHDIFKAENVKLLHRFRRSSQVSPEHDSITELRGPYYANKKSRYVELVLVVDHKLFVNSDKNKEVVYQHCKDIANIINALYVPLNIFIALVGVVVWSERDEIAIDANGGTTLKNFLHYRRKRLVKQHHNDNAQLLTGIQFENGVVGKAFQGTICTYEYSGGVSMDHSEVVALVAATVAHELGHNLGMEHDSSDCQCTSERCIMSPSIGNLSPTKWSSCSEKNLRSAFHQGMDYCLRNKPTKLFGSPVCGNGFVEPGEQCDCGLVDRCTNPCCNASTCMLHTNASCATGECCDLETCRPKIAGSVCRSADQECDLPEFCTGRSEYCPVDVFKMDGETCKHGKAFCYQGMCRTHSDQCKLLWGPSGNSSYTQCYKKNTDGTMHGNCGYNRMNQTYVKCVDDNVFCGMVQCQHLNEKLKFGMESASVLTHSFVYADGRAIRCDTAIVDLGLNEVDPGLAPDGSKCGKGKMCVNQKCVAVSSLRVGIDTNGCPQKCNGNGVCNSKGHCHCNPGFAPPFCDHSGTRGSKDSGPASDPNAGRHVITALYIIFLGIVPSVALMALLMYYYWPLVKHWWKKASTMAANGTRSSRKPGGQNRAASTPSTVKPSSHRPLISGPILNATTSTTARELVGGSCPGDAALVRPAPAVPAATTPTPTPLSASAPPAARKPLQPLSSPQEAIVVPPSSSARKRGSYPTLPKLASVLPSACSLRGRDDKRDQPQNVTAGKLLDKDKLRSLRISNPIPQEVPNAAPVQRTSAPAPAGQPVVMPVPAQSPEHAVGISRTRQSPCHATSSPPPLPDFPAKDRGLVGLPAYQNLPELKSSNSFPSDSSYDDCLNVVGKAPLAHIYEGNSPTSGENIYAVIDEQSPNQAGGRNSFHFSLPPLAGPEYISPTASEGNVTSVGSSESMALLGEIVSEIQARNTDLCCTSSVGGKAVADVDASDDSNVSECTDPATIPAGTYMNTVPPLPSGGYFKANVPGGPRAVGSSINASKCPSTAAPGTTSAKITSVAGCAPVSTCKPFGASLQSRGSLTAAMSKPSFSAAPVAGLLMQKLGPKSNESPKLAGTSWSARRIGSSCSASPYVVSSCSPSAGTSSPDVIDPANGGKSAHLPTSNSELMGVAKAQSNNKPSFESISSQRRTQTQSPQERAEASKICNVASLLQKFETGRGSSK